MLMTKVFYVCTQCGAEDSTDVFDGDHPIPVLNCTHCKAGLGVHQEEMLKRKIGMFLVPDRSRQYDTNDHTPQYDMGNLDLTPIEPPPMAPIRPEDAPF